VTAIVEQTYNITTVRWLCSKCVKAREAKGWTTRRLGNTHYGCDDCFKPDQVERVNFVPTSATSRFPRREAGYVSEMPETWPARLERLRKAAP
jgi:hypothetical protein